MQWDKTAGRKRFYRNIWLADKDEIFWSEQFGARGRNRTGTALRTEGF